MRQSCLTVFLLTMSLALGCDSRVLATEAPSSPAPSKSSNQTAAPAMMAGARSQTVFQVSKALRSALIENIPHIHQKPDFCGEACVAMFLKKLGKRVDQDWVFDQSGLSPDQGRGVYTKELVTALKNIGFQVQHPYKGASSSGQIRAELQSMVADLARGTPSIVCMRYSDEPRATEHFRLVLGYDESTEEVIYHEPAEVNGKYRRMKRSLFEKLWPLGPAGKPVVIRIPLVPGDLKEGTKSSEPTDADFAQHVMALKDDLPRGFKIVVQKPFVVIGNQPHSEVRRHAKRTVSYAVARLKKDYFTKDPDEIIDVWLFGDGPSYRRYAAELFGHNPDTPYGYFTEEFNALVMNISTGAGTLIHEIVHPLMKANFPECPPWFNEGMGSLYECSTTRDGHIFGLTNWRLPGLQKEIRNGGLPSFETLMKKEADEFYGDAQGDNYAQSRYLLQYLQEKGLLKKYYHTFYKNRKSDPTGFETLKTLLDVDDMQAFQKEWEKWAMKLRWSRD